MKRIILLAAFSMLTTTAAGLAQDRDRGPALRNGVIVIPSELTLEREAVTAPRNEFSTTDTLKQIERQNRRIDLEVERGICTGC